MDLQVLTWNVFHGRAVPGAGRDLCAEFAAALDGWEWDVALLQEVPPWWLERLVRTLGGEGRGALTSRRALLPVHRALAGRAPDLLGAAGAAANVILARSDRIIADGSTPLGRRPERRRVHGVALAVGVWVSNVQVSAHPAAAEADLRRAAEVSREWARARRLGLILGGEIRLSDAAASGACGLQAAASAGAAHVLCGEGATARPGTAARLEHGALSAHDPLAVTLAI